MKIVNDHVVSLVLLLASSSQNESLIWRFTCAVLIGTSEDHIFLKFTLDLILGMLFVYMLIFS